MIEAPTSFTAQEKPDTGYASWETAGRGMRMQLDPTERTAGPIPTFGSMVQETALAAQGNANAYAPASNSGNNTPDIAYETKQPQDDFSFGDVIDMINPLQHLPVIGTLYRKFTGDAIKPISNIIGGAIFGGPVGAVSSTVNVIVKDRTGKDVAENAFSLVGMDVSPANEKKPDIVYEPVQTGSSMTAANLYEKAGNTQKNFGGNNHSTTSWNA